MTHKNPGGSADPSSVWQSSEYGAIHKVVMCLANPFDRNPESLFADDESARFQAAANRSRPYDVELVHQQQYKLIELLESTGAEIILASPIGDCISQHYTRDIGFVVDQLFIVARPRRPYRQRELAGIADLLETLDCVVELDEGSIEGGDVLLHKDEVIVGFGEETDAKGVASLRRALDMHGINRRVVTLELAERGVIHTDTKFNIIGPELAIVDRNAFTAASFTDIEKRFELIFATPNETMNVEINTLVIAEKRLVMQSISHRLAEEVARHGIEPTLLDYSEVTALPGSFRCTTLPLVRA